MLKKFIFLAIILFVATGVSAGVLTPEEAYKRAVSSRLLKERLQTKGEPELLYTETTCKGSPALYLFRNNSGVIIVSASSNTMPILGYMDLNLADASQIPAPLKFWLEEYGRQIEYAEQTGAVFREPAGINYPSEWEYIAPMLKTKWAQGRPYSLDIPDPNYATGCVATAMAQIMNYWQYPEIGHGSNTYTYTNSFGQEVSNSMNFGEKPFDWDLMLDTYREGAYSQQEAEAVAYLMKACGYSTNMVYSASSGTQVEYVPRALIEFFGYDNNARAIQRYQYTQSEWAAILYNQLKTVGPVLYSGSSEDPIAHAFVADGYDGNGFFHINWGWAGLSDGFFALDALTPPVQSTGGGKGGYIFSQGMIVDIKKSEGIPSYAENPMLTLLGNMSGKMQDGLLTINMSQANPGNIVNTSSLTFSPVFGYSIENTASGISEQSPLDAIYVGGEKDPSFELPPGSCIWQEFQATASIGNTLPDGKYRITLLWKENADAKDWKYFTVASGCHDYIYLVKEADHIVIENLPLYRYSIDSAEITSPLVMSNPCEISFTLTNPSDYELTQSIFPVLYFDGNLSFTSQGQLVTVGPRQTVTTTLFYTFNAVSGGTSPTPSRPREYTLGAFDYCILLDENYAAANYGDAYYGDFGTYTMTRSSSGEDDSFKVLSIKIDNAADEGSGYDNVTGINDFSRIELSVSLEGMGKFLSTPLTAVVSPVDISTGIVGEPVYEKTFENLMYVSDGESHTSETTLKLTDYDISQIYCINIYYMYQKERKSLGSIKFAASTGVDKINSETMPVRILDGIIEADPEFEISNITVASMNGAVITKQKDLSSLPKGLYLIVVQGQDRTFTMKYLK